MTSTSFLKRCTQKRQFVNLEPTPTNHYERRWHSFFLDKRTKTSVLSVIYVYVSYFRHLYTDRLFVKIRTSERGVQKRNSPRKILSRQFKVLISYPYILGSTFISGAEYTARSQLNHWLLGESRGCSRPRRGYILDHLLN